MTDDIIIPPDSVIREEIARQFPYTKRVYVNDILPEDVQNRLMQIEYVMGRCSWEIGDIAVACTQRIGEIRQATGRLVTEQDVHDAIGLFIKRTGRTVRYYAETALYFPPAVRQEYAEIPFTTFVSARYAKDWRQFLDIHAEHLDWGLSRVHAEYVRLNGEQAPRKIENRVHERTDSDDEQSPAALPAPAYPRELSAGGDDDLPLPESGEVWVGGEGRMVAVMLARLGECIDVLRRVLYRVPLSTPQRVRLAELLTELADILAEIKAKA